MLEPVEEEGELPEHVDWYYAGKVSDSVDQQGCGSCWAFTTATTLESMQAIRFDMEKPNKFSVQYLLDCDVDEYNLGCEGGWMLNAFDFTRVNGIPHWDDYPSDYIVRKGP